MLKQLQSCNPNLTIRSITDPLFQKYGKVLNSFDFNECIDIMKNKPVPAEGTCYVAADADMMKSGVVAELSSRFYANMPVQVGYCNGNNTQLNALEYHKGSEIDVAVTDLVLILGDLRSIENNKFNSSSVDIFYAPAGTACELYATTLHFAPCKTSDLGFKSIIVLPEGTNAPLDQIPAPKCEEDKLLWMQNKWLIAHADSVPASNGAYAGITGVNLEIKY